MSGAEEIPGAVRTSIAARLERASLLGMALGVLLLLQPWWAGGVRAGFFVTLASTVLQIAASHAPRTRA